jgi:transcriptional regulator with GAF, ATPase, and Fis domain
LLVLTTIISSQSSTPNITSRESSPHGYFHCLGSAMSIQVGRGTAVSEDASSKSTKRTPVRSILAEVDRNQIVQALQEAGGRVGGRDGAAARLGLKRTTFITRMNKLGT